MHKSDGDNGLPALLPAPCKVTMQKTCQVDGSEALAAVLLNFLIVGFFPAVYFAAWFVIQPV